MSSPPPGVKTLSPSPPISVSPPVPPFGVSPPSPPQAKARVVRRRRRARHVEDRVRVERRAVQIDDQARRARDMADSLRRIRVPPVVEDESLLACVAVLRAVAEAVQHVLAVQHVELHPVRHTAQAENDRVVVAPTNDSVEGRVVDVRLSLLMTGITKRCVIS